MSAFSADDRRWMRRALMLARRGWGQTSPNPMVGAVVVRNGLVVGEGWHAAFGEAHAERVALDAAGELARGAILYVTLEPCNHTGKTPPCAPHVVGSGVARVVYAVNDPNPVSGSGREVLQAAGLRVDSGLEVEAEHELNAAFHYSFVGHRPFITLKLAVSLDSAVADASRSPGWLTGEKGRREVHRMRAGHDAIAVGSGTALADDPMLTVRGVGRPRVPPLRVVFDRRGRTKKGARMVKTAGRVPTLVVTGSDVPAALTALSARAVQVISARDLDDALGQLRARGVRSMLCEGGAELAGALLVAGVVDRLVIFRAPVVLGAGALPAFGSAPASLAASASRWRLVDQRWIGDDELTVYAPAQ